MSHRNLWLTLVVLSFAIGMRAEGVQPSWEPSGQTTICYLRTSPGTRSQLML